MNLCRLDGSDVRTVPIDPTVRLKRTDCLTEEDIAANQATHKHRLKLYQKIMGLCIFINNVCRPDISFAMNVLTCRPDISFAMNVLTRHMSNPSSKHLDVAIDLAKYLCTDELGIVYSREGNRRPILYCDADKG
jgi:hypothetical protein